MNKWVYNNKYNKRVWLEMMCCRGNVGCEEYDQISGKSFLDSSNK